MQAAEWLHSRTELIKSITETAPRDAQLILCSILRCDRATLISHPDRVLKENHLRKADQRIHKYRRGIPLPYVLGSWEFFGRDFLLSRHVLIPRPETEILVEHAIRWLTDHPGCACAADIGTGSGCIVVSLACAHGHLEYYASDISIASIRLAKRNVQKYGLEKIIHLKKTKMLFSMRKRFGLICCNLPYVPTSRFKTLSTVSHEPRIALDGGKDGFRIIDEFLAGSRAWLEPGGCIICEIDDTHEKLAIQAGERYWPEKSVKVHKDLSGRCRILIIE